MIELEDKCFYRAQKLIESGFSNIDIFELTDLLIKLEKEKIEKNIISDNNINYNDKIVDIEDCGVLETLDISVSGDNLFYCNGILTKNSFGLPATVDMLFAIMSTDELEQMNQILVKQLKNRYAPLDRYRKFVVGIDRSKMRLYDIDSSAQEEIIENKMKIQDQQDLKTKFNTFNFE